jgi:hypothetical protein
MIYNDQNLIGSCIIIIFALHKFDNAKKMFNFDEYNVMNKENDKRNRKVTLMPSTTTACTTEVTCLAISKLIETIIQVGLS